MRAIRMGVVMASRRLRLPPRRMTTPKPLVAASATGTAEVEETKEDGSIAGDREEEESTPEEGLSKVQE